ncbi:MAG TPA: DUF3822 family protein [Bacteroidetes bacterium]|nr:DUF3822 family protein [Bacteroidota bacterium]
MHELNLLDETLDINQTPSYHLSIQVCPDGFSFAILDLVRNKYVALRHYDMDPGAPENQYLNQLEKIIEEDEFLGKEYKSIALLMPAPRFTLVPAPLFQKENLRLYFEFNHPMEELDEMHANRLKNAGAYLIYALPSELGNTLIKHFQQAEFFHYGVPLIEHPLTAPGNKGRDPQALLHLHHEHMEMVVHGDKKLTFYNAFRFSHPHDVLFFVMYVLEQLKLNPEKTELLISGKIDKTSGIYLLLKQYIKNVGFARPNELFTYSYTFQDSPSHLFVHLLNLYSCV